MKHSVGILVFILVGCFAHGQLPNTSLATVIAERSCVGPDGQSRCGRTPRWNKGKANLLGASNGGDRAASIPLSQTVPLWVTDGQNVTGCANDNNNGTQSACGAVGTFQGPLLTMTEIAQRWGTYSPTLNQQTVISVWSNAPATDVFYENPLVLGATNYLHVLGNLGPSQQVWTGTLGTVTQKNKTAGTLLTSTFSISGAAADQLIVNSTHPSMAIVTGLNTGSTWNLSQPVTGCTPPVCSPSEVNTWVSGDTVTAYNPPNIYTPQAYPVANDIVNGEGFAVWLDSCTLQCAEGTEQCPFAGNQYVQLVNIISQRLHQDSDLSGGLPSPNYTNTDIILQYHGNGGKWFGGRVGFDTVRLTLGDKLCKRRRRLELYLIGKRYGHMSLPCLPRQGIAQRSGPVD